MRLLLDTHAAAWWWLDDAKLPQHAREAVASTGNEVFVSPVSAWEIATKYRLGKWPEAAGMVYAFDLLTERSGFSALPITIPHARLAGSLVGHHRDPFDRMLVAQAMCEQLIVVTRDPAITQYSVASLWDRAP